MNSNILFSVLIANYNNGRFLMEAVESVRIQTYHDWEIIIVDDGSTDESKELYKLLEKDSRIHIYYNDLNRGCAYTKHQCMLHANGIYCGYLDPDDTLLPNALMISIDALNKNSAAVLTMSRQYYCDENLNIVSESRLLELKKGESYFEHQDYVAECFAAFRKTAYLASGGLDISLKAGDDAELYFKLEEQGDIIIINEFTYKYRRVSSSITSNFYKTMYWNFIVRHNTCMRRNLPVENFSFKNFDDFVKSQISYALEQNGNARNSKAYKLGKFILHPFRTLYELVAGI